MDTRTALLTVDEAREALGGISVGTFYHLVADGLPLVKLRSRTFVRPEDIAEFVERNLRRTEWDTPGGAP